MRRVVCPVCKTGFEARITRENYAINCVSCGVAFNAAQYLPPEDFQAIGERRASAGSPSRFDRGSYALGNIIRPAETPPAIQPISPETRTGGLAFMFEEPEPRACPAMPVPAPACTVSAKEAVEAREPAVVAPVPVAAPEPPQRARPRSFLEASVTTSRRRALGAPNVSPSAVATGPLAAPPPSQAGSSPYSRSRIPDRQTGEPVYNSWLLRASQVGEKPLVDSQEARPPVAEHGGAGASPEGASQPSARRAEARKSRPPLMEGPFGDYEIEGELARGGVGAVFRARQVSTGKPVALKVLLEGEDADEMDRERFRHECETAKSLNLPGMVQILDVGEVDGKPYMAMELVEGRSLDKLIPERTLSVHECLVIMAGVAETAGALHEAGYVHRDVKPGNILLDAYGTPKLADFGLVKSLDEVTRLTASGLVCGTPAYMAPEQARGDGKAVDPRSDVWALGAVLYEMLTATPPFQADNALRLMLKITKEEPRPPRQLNPKIPRDVEAIVLKCLQKNAERRYPNGRALSQDLKRFLEGQPVSVRQHPTVKRLWNAAHERRGIALGVGAGLVAVFLAVAGLRIALAPANAETETARGWSSIERQDLDGAEEAFRIAIKADRHHARAHLGLGRVLASRALEPNTRRIKDPGLYREALNLTKRAAQLDPRLEAEASAQAGWLYMNAGLFAEEVRERERAVELDSANPDYYQALALAYWNLGGPTRGGASPGQVELYRKAARAFNTVLSLRQDYPRTREYLQILQEQFLSRTAHTASLGNL